MAPRLLILADPKMLPALSSGLRDGGRFEVVPQPIADLGAAQTHAAQADAVALFYGTAERPLVAALQQLAPAVRERGARVVAVLQKEQAALRDDCFRAGASDVLFMPLPKDQFVTRLADLVGLAWSGEGGQAALQATVSTRTVVHPLDAAAVVDAGLLAPVGPELKAGETVRLSWTGAGAVFTSWGLVVRSDAQGARVRVAGLTPSEETRFKEWLAGVKVQPVAPAPSWATAATISESKIYPPTIAETPVVPSPEASPEATEAISAGPGADQAVTHPSALVTPTTLPTLPSFPAASGNSNPGRLPTAGPPPGFAARPPVRPQSPRQASRPGTQPGLLAPKLPSSPSLHRLTLPSSATPLPVKLPSIPSVPAPVLTPAAPGPAAATTAAPSESNGVTPAPAAAPAADGGLAGLFDDAGAGSGPAMPGAPAPAEAPGPVGISWPTAFDPAIYQGWLAVMLRERNLPAEAGPELTTAFLKVCGGLSSVEREGLDKAGPDSPFHEALVARAALAFAGAAGARLASAQPPPMVEQEQVGALTQFADNAGKHLQAEADRAIGRGEVEILQMVTAASGPLSREQLAFKEVVDRLRGLGAAPRLGAGALDPHMLAPGQAPRAQSRTVQQAEQAKRAELKDFENFRNDPTQKSRKKTLLVLAGVLVVLAANVAFFSAGGLSEAPNSLVEIAGTGVLQIQVSETNALVKVTKTWFNSPRRRENVKKLCEALEQRKTQRAVLTLETGGTIGYIEVPGCNAFGLGPPPKPVDPNAPPK